MQPKPDSKLLTKWIWKWNSACKLSLKLTHCINTKRDSDTGQARGYDQLSFLGYDEGRI